jgi:hypothetical protein
MAYAILFGKPLVDGKATSVLRPILSAFCPTSSHPVCHGSHQ